MIGFLIKKVFFDIWDNMLRIIGVTLVYVVCLGLVFIAGSVGEFSSILSIAVMVAAVFAFSFHSLGVSGITKAYSEYHTGGFKAYKEAVMYHWGHGLLHVGLCIFLFLIAFYLIPFYFALNSLVGVFLGMVMFWIGVIVVLAMQYFYPLCMHMQGDKALKTLKKCFVVLFDNPGVSLFLLFRTVIDLALTIVTATLIPGLAGISLSRMDTVRLLMLKYDFLEANPGCTKKDVNWEDLLYDERELVGPRSLRGMLFPWKD